ncbi:MAG: ribosome biogenesis GTPase Der [Polyangiaceae bacterium]|nr:ribosome biogenesis GTPase Der [Polyangiaceae bacterium]
MARQPASARRARLPRRPRAALSQTGAASRACAPLRSAVAWHQTEEAPEVTVKPIVAVVGRPNVGKSTLFNRMTRSKSAIVHDEPGVTRDRHYADVVARDRTFTLVDTGGLDPTSDDPMKRGIKKQIEAALAEADVVVCVLDAREPATSIDHAEISMLRRASKPTIFIANKADSPAHELEANELYRLGIERIIPISALQGRRMDELEGAIVAALPPKSEDEDAAPEHHGAPRIAVIGKPNAGKSSLINRLSGEERMLVDDKPGTTRDAIDTVVERRGKRYVFVDTAGIRRKAKVKKEGDEVEGASVIQAIRAMDRSEIVVLLTDAKEGVAEQDAKVLGLAVDRGRAVIVGLNKVDLLDKQELAKAEEDARDKLSFAPWATYIRMSAKSGRGVDTLLDAIDKTAETYKKRITTGELNRFFEKVLQTRPPPTHGGRAPRLFFITQAESSPPLFVVQASDPDKIHFSYQRFVQNQIRKAFAFDGVPLTVIYRKRRRRGEER